MNTKSRISLDLKSSGRSSLRYGLFLIGLALALWAMPGIVRGQVVGGDLFSTVNLGGSYINGASPLYRYTPDGSSSIFASALDTPRGVAVDSDGNVYVTNNANVDPDPFANPPAIQGTIFKITPGGLMTTFATNFPVGFLQGLVTDSARNVFVVAQDDGFNNKPSAIYKITPDGILTVDPPFASLDFTGWGLACDRAGY